MLICARFVGVWAPRQAAAERPNRRWMNCVCVPHVQHEIQVLPNTIRLYKMKQLSLLCAFFALTLGASIDTTIAPSEEDITTILPDFNYDDAEELSETDNSGKFYIQYVHSM